MRWPGPVERTVRLAVESAAGGTPTVLDITGPAGYGKSTLARWVARQFPPVQVLRATARDHDQADALGVVRQLGVDLPDGDANPLRVARRIGQRIDELQLTGPVVVLIDDVQWADPESIDAIGVLLDRMAGDRVLVVGAHRPGGAQSGRWSSHVDAASAVLRVSLDGLDDGSALQVVRETHPDAPVLLAERLRQHTGGSPLLLRSLLREYSVDRLQAMADHGGLPAPSDLVAAVRERLSHFAPDAAAVLEALAVLGDGGADMFVTAAVADVRDLDQAMTTLRSERLVVVDDQPVRRARIFHGVLRAAVYENIPTSTRQRLHGRAAARLTSPRDRLDHRVAAARTVDDGLAADLDAFADDLHDRRQFRGAAQTRRQAAFLSSAPEARLRRERDADFEAILALDLADVTTDDGMDDTDPRTRFTLGARLVAERRYVAAAELLESLSDDELRTLGDATAYRARVLRGWALISAGRSAEQALHDLEEAQRSPAVDQALQGYFSIAYGQAYAEAAPALQATGLDDVMSAERSHLSTTPAGLTRLAWRGSSTSLMGFPRMAIDDLDIVISRLNEGIVDFGDGVFYAFQGLAYFTNGQWGRASISLGLARVERQALPAPLTSSILPLVPLIAGDRDRTREALDEARSIRVRSPQRASVFVGDTVEVLALTLLGTPVEREHWLEHRTSDFGSPDLHREFSAAPIWCVAQSIAASWAGRSDDAREWARTVRANRFGHWAAPAARWLEARTEADAVFAETVEPLSRDGIPDMPIVEALIHLDLARRGVGAVQHAARARTEQAFAAFGGERVLASLFAPGAGADPTDTAGSSTLATLTDREREIATLLLEGLSYAQIGKELFITRSTVSFHLTRIYAKTGTTSRHELAQATHNATRSPRPRATT